MYVEDALGKWFLVTYTVNSRGNAEGFRRSARLWVRGGYKRAKPDHWPCFPCKIVVEPYQDDSSPN